MKQPRKVQKVTESLTDFTSRFLLIFMDSSYIESRFLKMIQRQFGKVTFLLGSSFDFDVNDRNLSLDYLKEIKFIVEQGTTLIMKVPSPYLNINKSSLLHHNIVAFPLI